MTSVCPLRPEPKFSQWKCCIVENNQTIGDRYLEFLEPVTYRTATTVHIGGGLDKVKAFPSMSEESYMGESVQLEYSIMLFGQVI